MANLMTELNKVENQNEARALLSKVIKLNIKGKKPQKIKNVLVKYIQNEDKMKRDFWKNVVNGYIPRYFMVNKCITNNDELMELQNMFAVGRTRAEERLLRTVGSFYKYSK